MKNSVWFRARMISLAFLLCVSVALAEESSVRCYPLPDHGSIQLSVPAQWKDQLRQPPNRLPPTIVFSEKTGTSFEVLITPMWSAKKDLPPPSAEMIRDIVQEEATKAASQAVQKRIDLIELKGASGSGFYFAVTDRAPPPGEYKHMTQGMITIGKLFLTFTILTNDGQQPIVAKALSMLMTATHNTAGALTARTTIPIPGGSWYLEFDGPKLSEQNESRKGANYAFKGNSGRFNLSLFVEMPEGVGKTHEDCYRFYWPKASRNPRILKESVLVSRSDKYYRAQYDIRMEFAGRPVTHRNVNYYIAFQGRWVDVHISIIDPTPEDDIVIAAFDRSLVYRMKTELPVGGDGAPSTPHQ
jgi:hypothetical protein